MSFAKHNWTSQKFGKTIHWKVWSVPNPWALGACWGVAAEKNVAWLSSSSNGSRNCLIEWLGDIHIYIYIIIVVHACGDPQKNWVHHFCAKWFSLSLRSGPSNSPQFASLYVGDLHPDVTEAAQPADNVWWHWRCQTFRMIHENSRYVVSEKNLI